MIKKYIINIVTGVVLALVLNGCSDAPAVDGDIEVSWDANAQAEEVTEYIVFRDGIEHVRVPAPIPWTSDRVSVVFREYPGTHCFVVRAVNLWGTSPESEQACVHDGPSRPTGVQIR